MIQLNSKELKSLLVWGDVYEWLGNMKLQEHYEQHKELLEKIRTELKKLKVKK